MMKRCGRCGEEKELSEFPVHRRKKDGHNSWCFSCKKAYDKEYHREHREEILKSQKAYRRENIEREQDSQYRRRYGISLAQYDAMLERQANTCAICGKTPEENEQRLSVDHDHDTGEVRSLLCNGCNGALGLMQDDPDVLQAACDYLKEWKNVN